MSRPSPLPLLEHVEPRLRDEVRAQVQQRLCRPAEPVPRATRVVLVGHRGAGKSTLLAPLATWLGRQAIDLDTAVERRRGQTVKALFAEGENAFRKVEAEEFLALPRDCVVAVGGGFWSNHPRLLLGQLAVEVPVSFATYRERALADTTRPRLFPALSIEDEIRQVWSARTRVHQQHPVCSLVEFLARATVGDRPLRVVTVPPRVDPLQFSSRALLCGADVVEIRTDLHDERIDIPSLAEVTPLLVSERGRSASPAWRTAAHWFDVDCRAVPGRDAMGSVAPPAVSQQASDSTAVAPTRLVSFHAARPLTVNEALAVWDSHPAMVALKHVEPIREPADGVRLLQTQNALLERFGPRHLTVLATGPLAPPFRALLALRNAFDYLALDETWSAAPGQLLLADAVRQWKRGVPSGPRRALVGHRIGHAQSPRVHQQPFDRLDLDPSQPAVELVRALQPWYQGFAITSPWKREFARVLAPQFESVNTVWHDGEAWRGANTDVAGAEATLRALDASEVTVLGEGGVAAALREAAAICGVQLRFLRRAQLPASVSGAAVWTWPPDVALQHALTFKDATVAMICYGAPARRLRTRIRYLGGDVRSCGPLWFVAQLRKQRLLLGEQS